MADTAKWEYNIGDIFLSNAECFWIFPSRFFTNNALCITSSWFSHENETWRIVKAPNLVNNNFVCLFLWKKVRRCTPVPEYTVEMCFKTPHTDQLLHMSILENCSGNQNSDFGYACYDFCNLLEFQRSSVSRCGLMKLFFVIREKNSVVNYYRRFCYETDNVDDINRENEASSEDEMTRDEKNDEKENILSENKGMEILSDNLKQVFLDGRMSDAVVKVDGREFKVHKVILVARSPVFASMFEHDMAEKKENTVDVPDCTAESFEVFLHYLYSGSVETMSVSNVYNVYYAADKYRVEDLKEKSVQFMIDNISAEAFCDVISLALRHEESKLQKIATNFFSQNIKKIIKTVQWQKFLDENSTQANELLIKALSA